MTRQGRSLRGGGSVALSGLTLAGPPARSWSTNSRPGGASGADGSSCIRAGRIDGGSRRWTVSTPWWTCRIGKGRRSGRSVWPWSAPSAEGSRRRASRVRARSAGPGDRAVREGGFSSRRDRHRGVALRFPAAPGHTYEWSTPKFPAASSGPGDPRWRPGGTPGTAEFRAEPTRRSWCARIRRGAGLPRGAERVEVVFSREVEGVHAFRSRRSTAAAPRQSDGRVPAVRLRDRPALPRGASVRCPGNDSRRARAGFAGDVWGTWSRPPRSACRTDAAGAPGSLVDVPIASLRSTACSPSNSRCTTIRPSRPRRWLSKTSTSDPLILTYNLSRRNGPGSRCSGPCRYPARGPAGGSFGTRIVGAVRGLDPLDLVQAEINEGAIPTVLDDGTLTVCDGLRRGGDGVSLCDGDCDDPTTPDSPETPRPATAPTRTATGPRTTVSPTPTRHACRLASTRTTTPTGLRHPDCAPLDRRLRSPRRRSRACGSTGALRGS